MCVLNLSNDGLITNKSAKIRIPSVRHCQLENVNTFVNQQNWIENYDM